jgi:hypothetical protein
MFGPKSENLRGECRKFHKEELHKLYPSSNIIRKKKSRKIRETGNTDAWERPEIYKTVDTKGRKWISWRPWRYMRG